MATFTINGKEYKAKPLNFKTICDFEGRGIALSGMSERVMSTAMAYFGICANRSNDWAAEEIEKHIIGGGDLGELYNAFTAEVEQSGFFQAMARKSAETEEVTEEA